VDNLGSPVAAQNAAQRAENLESAVNDTLGTALESGVARSGWGAAARPAPRGLNPLSAEQRFAKRAFDLVLGALVLLALAPLMMVIALAIRLESRGPVLFRQTRIGFDGRPFEILKFRSMVVMEDGPDVEQVRPGDPRVTRIGAVLRRMSLDELPQLFNVLRGEMSLVGPRPHAVKHDRDFATRVENYAFRQHVKAGLTGWAQVHGARGPTLAVEQIQRRVELDLWYVRNWSVALDLSILLRTAPAVIRGRNAL
jgi:exopolysaccharide biosynthesis polyprenyl glycosylphosphotransferase